VRLDGKVAVIVGASRGVGLTLCREFAAAGAKVVFGARSADKITALEQELSAAGHQVCAVQADVSREEDCRKLINTAVERFGRVDILVNNAAIAGPTKLICDLEPDEWAEVIAINLTSLYLTIRFI